MTTKVDIRWTEGVPASRRPQRLGVVKTISAALEQRPGQWAEVLRFGRGSSAAHNSRRRLEKAGLEAVTRTDSDTGEVVVYARKPA